jgi:hypothetical protein
MGVARLGGGSPEQGPHPERDLPDVLLVVQSPPMPAARTRLKGSHYQDVTVLRSC